jgi:inhibitor of cysteine peptidase
VTPPPTAPGPIDPHKAGTYVFGPWKYRLDITDPDTRSEGRWGWLYYAGQRLPHGAVNDYYRTPWGSMYWVDVPQPRWGAHGWMTGPSPQNNRPGQALALPAALAAAARSAPPTPPTAAATPLAPQTAPAAAAGQAVEIGKADSGKRLRVTLGQPIVLRLPGNPTTGYRWQIAAAAGQAVRVVGDPTYSVPPAAAGRVGAGGSFTFRLQAAQQGSTTLKLFYVRPWEKGKPPADAFTVTLDVTGR